MSVVWQHHASVVTVAAAIAKEVLKLRLGSALEPPPPKSRAESQSSNQSLTMLCDQARVHGASCSPAWALAVSARRLLWAASISSEQHPQMRSDNFTNLPDLLIGCHDPFGCFCRHFEVLLASCGCSWSGRGVLHEVTNTMLRRQHPRLEVRIPHQRGRVLCSNPPLSFREGFPHGFCMIRALCSVL